MTTSKKEQPSFKEMSKLVASTIFREAAKLLTVKFPYMCSAIRSMGIYTEGLEVYGFSREEYHNFIKRNYPNLERLLMNSVAWIAVYSDDEDISVSTIVKSKKKFLNYLADKLDLEIKQYM